MTNSVNYQWTWGGREFQRFRYVTEGEGILLTLRTITRGRREEGPNFRQKQLYVTFEWSLITQTRRPPPTLSHINHFQNFDKIDSFLQSILNILILCNLIVGWDDRVIKEGAGILQQIYRFRGGAFKSWGEYDSSK